jgi:hypothetical protein
MHLKTLMNHSIITTKPSEDVTQQHQSIIVQESICNKTTNEQQNNLQKQQQLIQKQHQMNKPLLIKLNPIKIGNFLIKIKKEAFKMTNN